MGDVTIYWDPADFSLDGDQDADLQPGGLDEFQPIEVPVAVDGPPPVPNTRAKAYSNSSWFDFLSHHCCRVPRTKADPERKARFC